ncbi:MAG: 16S rRNA (guanine(527)-N(7))-methyltransferase RsmG [Alkalilacustris sp.]
MRQYDSRLGLSVSRETLERLERFAGLLEQWTRTINLISPRDVEHLWRRHIRDSAQLYALRRPGDRLWLDIGTGGGFPGLVIAILAADTAPDLSVVLVESDRRKAAFLRAAAIACNVTPSIHAVRAEALVPQKADVLSARALAPLSQLLVFAERHLTPSGRCLFPKGASSDAEIASALAMWRMTVQKIPSQTDSEAVILAIEGVRRA